MEYQPFANIQDGGLVDFFIPGNGEEYVDLSSSLIWSKIKIVKSDGKVMTLEDKVGPANVFLRSLFSQVNVSLNEIIISSSTDTYPYRAYVENFLNYGEDAKKNFTYLRRFFQRHASGSSDPLAEEPNDGLEKRYDLCKLSQSLHMMGQLDYDVFQQNRLILSLGNVKIKMILSKPEFCLLSSQPDAKY